MLADGYKEDNEGSQFQGCRNYQGHAPLPLGNTGRPAQQYACDPKHPGNPSARAGVGTAARHLGNGVEANSHDEGPNPTKDLGMAVGLDPGCGSRCPVVAAD